MTHRTIFGSRIPDLAHVPLSPDPGTPLHQPPHFTRFVVASLGLHILLIVTALLVSNRLERSLPALTPVDIVNLPRNILEKLPPVNVRPVPSPSVPPAPPGAVPDLPPKPQRIPGPEHFGSAPDISLPRTSPPPGLPEGSEKGTADRGMPESGTQKAGKGPLPFLSQADIDAFARKGMPAKKPGDNSVTLDTDEFKFISYNRWLKIKVESVLRYPELAALSGLQGTLYIKFDILKDGSLGGLEIIQPSGYKILDDEALRAIRMSAPFEPLPGAWNMDVYTIRAAVLFYLSGAYIR